MSSHDPLCPHRQFIPGNGVWIEGFSDPPKPVQCYEPCQCDLIAKVRADEQEQAAQRVGALSAETARWPEPMSMRAVIAAFVGMGDSEPELQDGCFECAGEAESYSLALSHAIAAVRGESSDE